MYFIKIDNNIFGVKTNVSDSEIEMVIRSIKTSIKKTESMCSKHYSCKKFHFLTTTEKLEFLKEIILDSIGEDVEFSMKDFSELDIPIF